MKINTIRLLHGDERLTNYEFKEYAEHDAIWGNDRDPEEVMRWPIDQEDLAKAELAKHLCTYSRGVSLHFIEEWALEYFEAGEDGEFVEGSDFIFADNADTEEE